MELWGSVLELASQQYGCVATSQAAELGVASQTFLDRVRNEGWGHPWTGVWTLPGSATGRLGQLSRLVLAGGPDVAVTGRDALWLHGLDLRLGRRPRLVVPMSRHAARHWGSAAKLISSRTLATVDITRRRRLSCTTPARALVDLVVPPSPTVAVVRDVLVTARQARLVDTTDLARSIGRARGVPGIAVLRRAVADVTDVEADSPFSDRVHRRLRRSGLHPDRTPAVIAVPGRVLHPDITFADARVGIECDSMLAHSSQRDLMVDNRKDRATALVGWTVLRIGHLEFDRHWGRFLGDLQRALGRV